MPLIFPFPALRPLPELASKICAPPYDVLSSDEAREMAKDNPLSFLHVSKSEIDLAPSLKFSDPRVYEKARENFQKLIEAKKLLQDSQPCFYLYRQSKGDRSQTGLVAVASCQDYEKNIIRKHELTRPDKEKDRVKHIETLNSQTGPAFLIHRADPEVEKAVLLKTSQFPEVDFTAEDGVRHASWKISDPGEISFLQKTFEKMEVLYIADGHHRSAAAHRIWKSRGKPSPSHQPPLPSAFFLAVIFPENQVQILPCHRVVRDLGSLVPQELIQKMEGLGKFEANPDSAPMRKHSLRIFMEGRWRLFRWNPELVAKEDPAGQLDVALLQKHVLGPLLGIDNPRTSKRITFVGGIRGESELEKLARSGKYSAAFSMHPTSLEDLIQIVDQGGIMPPKSTWFEPKLRDAMFCHMLEAK